MQRSIFLPLFALVLVLLPPSPCRAFSVDAGGAAHPSTVVGHDRPLRVVVIGAGVGGLATAARISSQLAKIYGVEEAKAAAAFEVIVIDKNGIDFAGGRCGSFDVKVDGVVGSFRHERGPSLLLLREEYERLFADCLSGSGGGNRNSSSGDAARSYGLEMTQCVPAYQVVFEDGDAISLGFPRSKCSLGYSVDDIKEIQMLEQESIAKFDSLEPDGYRKWQEYLDTCAAFLDCGLPNFIEERLDLASLPAFLTEALRESGRRWPLRPHSDMLSSLFASPKLIALASFQDLYVGLEPYANSARLGGGVMGKTAPAVFGLLAAIELHPTNDRAGVFAPVGGFRRVAESMRELCLDLGVEFRFDAPVAAVTDGGVHLISKTDGNEFLPADLVICNADVPYATETILADGPPGGGASGGGRERDEDEEEGSSPSQYWERYDWNDEFEFSSGVIAFHWSLSRRLESLNTHNVFMSAGTAEDAEKSWAVLRGDQEGASCASPPGAGSLRPSSMIDRPFNFYVHRAGRADASACPPGCYDSVMVLVPCPALARDAGLSSLPREDAVKAYRRQFDADVVDDLREAVLRRLSVLGGLEDLEDSILDEVVDTPGSYADYYNVGAGVPFGLSHGLGQLSLTRPAAECKTRKNVLFVGASSRPGNGVPLVLIGSRQVAEKAVKRLVTMIARGHKQ